MSKKNARHLEAKAFLVKPGASIRLDHIDPAQHRSPRGDPKLAKALQKDIQRMAELEVRLYAERKRSLLIVLQAMDAGGKDGTIRHVMSGLNPQSCRVASFKKPAGEEAEHDFLWRIHRALPAKGEIGIFNRSHYEDVLVARVDKLVPRKVWKRRYQQINDFEQEIADSGTTILKFFLHISKEEQGKRFQARLDDPTKHWKLSLSDFTERKRWDEYQAAFEEMISRCSTTWAPWYVVPADYKWFRNYVVARAIVGSLAEMNPQFPPAILDVSKIKLK